MRTPQGSRTRKRAVIATAGAAALAISGFVAGFTPAGAAQAPSASTQLSSHGTTYEHSCATPAKGMMACNALHITNRTEHIAKRGAHKNAAPSGLGAGDLQSAYNLSKDGGAGQTVAIIDAYDDPNAEKDLAVYRQQYGLPECSTANGCFKKVGEDGTSKLPTGDTGWAGEISLDVDMVSAIAPNAKILLVEANQPSMEDLGTAVNTAVKMGAKYVSNSYGGGEESSDSTYDENYFNHPGVAITVSSGDDGYGVEYPAASKYVTAVGGTSLKKDSSSRGWGETAWNGAGSGCSSYDAKPSYQKDTGCSKRSVADVAAVADPATGVAVYQTYGGSGWAVYGGTSAAAPIIAGVYADGGAPGNSPASDPYAHTSSLNDVTSGSNGSCTTKYLCTAGSGYDGPTGLGTPNGTTAFKG